MPDTITYWHNSIRIAVYNDRLEMFRKADVDSGRIYQPDPPEGPALEPQWPPKPDADTGDFDPGNTTEFSTAEFSNFWVKSANPTCKVRIEPPKTGADGIERVSAYRVLAHALPHTSPPQFPDTHADSRTYTLDDKWDMDDAYAGAIYDGWRDGDTARTLIEDYQRVICNDTGEDGEDGGD